MAVDPLSDVGVRLTSYEVDETEQLVERRVGVHQRPPERGSEARAGSPVGCPGGGYHVPRRR